MTLRLWKIRVKHYAPKDSHEAIQGFLLRETEEEVCDYVMTNLGYWDEDTLDEEVERYFYNEETDEDGYETLTKREELLRNHGQIHLDSNDYSDSHYGITHYGWELIEHTPAPDEIDFLHRCGMLVDAIQEMEDE